ncbi:molecular chaperone [[Enterobacter] lignolyticus]|uniref:Long polar fimbrial chaperone LpfB n=1 Tax=[Enterobacter] lignolyticus TaxID=1334193 RepID=A0A806XDQ9_9ENTR|nr:molecular chaperone [[Enterobacter] lignolyticus]ALR76881.1 long polar fimbrial chaperone LpfB [[Enterobacter] lignolyticus]
MKVFSGATAGALLILATLSAARAGVIIGGTRVIYEGDKKEAALSISNPDTLPYLIQSWIETPEPGGRKAPFIITPPLYRLDKGQQNVMRIVKTGQLPEDKESLFWLSIKSIPSVAPRDNTLQIAVKTRIKLIYRPQTLRNTGPEEQAGLLKWQRVGNRLQVMNPSAYYINFSEIRVSGKKLDDVTFVAPRSSASFLLPSGISPGSLNFKIINDYGGIGDAHDARL